MKKLAAMKCMPLGKAGPCSQAADRPGCPARVFRQQLFVFTTHHLEAGRGGFVSPQRLPFSFPQALPTPSPNSKTALPAPELKEPNHPERETL